MVLLRGWRQAKRHTHMSRKEAHIQSSNELLKVGAKYTSFLNGQSCSLYMTDCDMLLDYDIEFVLRLVDANKDYLGNLEEISCAV